MPVLPPVYSTTVIPGLSMPRRSARSIIDRAIRSVYDPVGLQYSSFTSTCAAPSGTIVRSRADGELAMACSIPVRRTRPRMEGIRHGAAPDAWEGQLQVSAGSRLRVVLGAGRERLRCAGAFDHEPQHDRQLPEQGGLRIGKHLVLIVRKEEPGEAQDDVGDAVDDQPHANEPRQETRLIRQGSHGEEP